MPYDPRRHHRRSIRLPERDYSGAGTYNVTICTVDRSTLFGDVVEGGMELSPLGEVVRNEWSAIPAVTPGVLLDEFVVMPNHLHGVVKFPEVDNGAGEGVLRFAPSNRGRPTLALVIRKFKARATVRARILASELTFQVWQRGYYEHVVRGEGDLERIRDYIRQNPVNWHDDEENPGRQSPTTR